MCDYLFTIQCSIPGLESPWQEKRVLFTPLHLMIISFFVGHSLKTTPDYFSAAHSILRNFVRSYKGVSETTKRGTCRLCADLHLHLRIRILNQSAPSQSFRRIFLTLHIIALKASKGVSPNITCPDIIVHLSLTTPCSSLRPILLRLKILLKWL
jgi:hypothetical protein